MVEETDAFDMKIKTTTTNWTQHIDQVLETDEENINQCNLFCRINSEWQSMFD